MTQAVSYPVSETFLSVQGEGVHMGRRAHFVRLFGCNIKCAWCDSRYAWTGEVSQRMTADEIAGEVRRSGAEISVITGGEPCIYDLRPLLSKLSESGVAAHLETSGTSKILEGDGAKFDWVALSPKLFCAPRHENLARADELKFVVSDTSELFLYEKFAESAVNAKAFWLHPEWSHSNDKKLLSALCRYVESNGGRFRVGWQIHKCYSVR